MFEFEYYGNKVKIEVINNIVNISANGESKLAWLTSNHEKYLHILNTDPYNFPDLKQVLIPLKIQYQLEQMKNRK